MKKIIAFAIAGWCLLSACSKVAPKADKEVDSYPDIFPDYTEVTVPTHIAPLLAWWIKRLPMHGLCSRQRGNRMA